MVLVRGKEPFGREASSFVRPTMSMGSISTLKNETNRKVKLYTKIIHSEAE